MPAGAPWSRNAGRARPARLAPLRWLPQDEVHRVALVGRDLDARARKHLVGRTPRQRAVARRAGKGAHGGGRKQHMILRDIGDAARDEPLDHRAHLLDILSGAGLGGGRKGPEGRDVLVELALGRLGHLGDRLVERQGRMVTLGARVDLVVDVGDVADVENVIRAVDMAQKPEQHVEDDDRPGVADMRVVVDGRPADIELGPPSGRSARNPPCGGSACCKVEASPAAPRAHRPARRWTGGVFGWLHRELLSASSRGRTAQSAAARDRPDDRFS